MRNRMFVRFALPMLMALPAVGFIGCESSDPVAIEGSIITVTAQPNPVAPGAISVIQARVTTESGVPQEGAVVIFSSTNGDVNPEDDITDDEGRAFTDFMGPSGTATVTARSGSITGQVNLTISSNPPTAIAFTTTSSDQQIDACSEDIILTGRVVGSGATGVSGARVDFDVVAGTTPSSVNGTFTPNSVLTDSSGDFTEFVAFRLNSSSCTTCESQSCTIVLQASSGTVTSNTVSISESLSQ